MMTKAWRIAPPAPEPFFQQNADVHRVVAQVLYNRGITTPQEVLEFLATREDPRTLIDPFDFKDMHKAVSRIVQALKHHEPIAVYGDFDADGVTATALVMHVLRAIGADARPYIPHRVDEGYGLNTEALQTLASQGVKLVITVDCGIRAVQEVEDGKQAGLDIIITDHHSVGDVLPDALAVINPQQPDCHGDKRIAGVGVALMLAHALLKTLQHKDVRYSDLLDLVAIGTVADIMPLNAPVNRAFVKHGLSVIAQGRRVGLNALMQVANINPDKVDAMNIGFGIGPRINAAGRLDSAMQACELLLTDDEAHAMQLAQRLQALNVQRQTETQEAEQRIIDQLIRDAQLDGNLIFAQDDEVSQGIVGLVAGRLAQNHYRPTIVLERGETESHASCRSIPEFHITHALDQCADLLVRHGGHAMAAGLTIHNDNIPAFYQKMRDLVDQQLAHLTLTPTIDIDMTLNFSQFQTPHGAQIAEQLRQLEPTGHANPAPLFVTYGLTVLNHRPVGKDDAHLKLTLGYKHHEPIDAIAFRMGDWSKKMPDKVDVVYHLELNEWQGRTNLQLNIRDMRPHEATTA